MNHQKRLFAALLTTFNRSEMLANRSLPSVAAQTRLPDLVVISDDSTEKNLLKNKKTIASFTKQTGIKVIHLDSHRQFRNIASAIHPPTGFDLLGKHNSARNAAVLTTLAEGFSHQNDWVAFLDDDDEWLPRHLEQAEDIIIRTGRKGIDFLPAVYEYRLPDKSVETRLPPKFNGRDFIVGNPGVEGSTFVIRLSALLRAGMFDESLPASDDRDLCVSLSLLDSLRYQQPPEQSVIYHNDNISRITVYQGNRQLAGINRFMDKYRGWMSEQEYTACCKRAKKLFGWRAASSKFDTTIPAAPSDCIAHTAEKIALVIGVIIHPEEQDNPLFDDILKLSKDKRLSSMDVVIMPCSGTRARRLQNILNKLREAGMRVYCPDKAYINEIMQELAISGNESKSRPIAVNRTILQRLVFSVGNIYRNAVYWILDGDIRLHALTINNGKVTKTIPDYISEMILLRATGCDVAVGSINGAAPLPRAFTVRTQMLDLLHFFSRLRHSPDKRHFPALTIANAAQAKIAGDYYHDCGNHPHLEQPVGLLPLSANCTEHQFIRKLPRLIDRILAGDAVTRPLLDNIISPVSSRLHRGGNTLIFNSDALRTCANGFARGVLADIRRQDEMWRIIGEAALGWKITSGNFSVTQTRRDDPPQAPDIKRIRADITGHAFSSSLRQLTSGRQFNGVDELIAFIVRHDVQFLSNADKFARIRQTMIYSSSQRIIGIAESLRGMIEKRKDTPSNKQAITALRNIEKSFSRSILPAKTLTEEYPVNTLRTVLADFPIFCRDLKKSAEPSLRPPLWVIEERKKNAGHFLARTVFSKKPLRFLGSGGEGTVFTDKKNIYKIIHRWYSRHDINNPNFILQLHQSAETSWNAVYPITDFIRDDGDLLLVMPYEKTALYNGGYGTGMVAMLKEFKERGICLWDIAPKNLRRKNDSVRLIDYGQHIQPFTDKDFDLSARKAWLCWRFGDKENIRALLTATLTNKTMPALKGYQNMKTSVEQYAARYRGDDTAIDEILSDSPQRILDYGCGRGSTALMLTRKGLSVDVHDPNLSEKNLHKLKSANLQVMSAQDIAAATQPYDAILIRHVICEIMSDQELIKCLHNIHRLTAANGKAVITACDMDRPVREKLYAINHIPRGATSNCKFLYRKQIRINDAIRRHIHRPQKTLEKLFRQAGFIVTARKKFPDMDLETFQMCGGVLQWVLKPSKSINRKK